MAVQCLDNTLRPSTVTYGPPCGQNAVFDDRIADVLVRPELLCELLLWHHTVAMLEQVEQHLERFRAQGVLRGASAHRT
jgi:hypothetical protein